MSAPVHRRYLSDTQPWSVPIDTTAAQQRDAVAELFKKIEELLVTVPSTPERTRALVKVEETYRYIDVAIRAGSADRYVKETQLPLELP